jgi:hypothetical protein
MLTQRSAAWSPHAWIRTVCARGGGAVNRKSTHSQRFRCLPRDLQRAILDLPEPLQHAVHYAVARCQPQYAPRLYADDWREELYHEAIVAAWEAYQTYDPDRNASLYGWGVRVIGQRLQVFCDSVWGAAKRECEYPCDEETGEPVEFPDSNAFEAVEGRILVCVVVSGSCSVGNLCCGRGSTVEVCLPAYPAAACWSILDGSQRAQTKTGEGL